MTSITTMPKIFVPPLHVVIELSIVHNKTKVWEQAYGRSVHALIRAGDLVWRSILFHIGSFSPLMPVSLPMNRTPASVISLLAVFNTLGQQVAILVEGEVEAVYHEVQFDASRLSSGVYLYRLTAGSYVETRKLVLVR